MYINGVLISGIIPATIEGIQASADEGVTPIENVWNISAKETDTQATWAGMEAFSM